MDVCIGMHGAKCMVLCLLGCMKLCVMMCMCCVCVLGCMVLYVLGFICCVPQGAWDNVYNFFTVYP